jgi:hypothetical protein
MNIFAGEEEKELCCSWPRLMMAVSFTVALVSVMSIPRMSKPLLVRIDRAGSVSEPPRIDSIQDGDRPRSRTKSTENLFTYKHDCTVVMSSIHDPEEHGTSQNLCSIPVMKSRSMRMEPVDRTIPS